MIALLQIYCCMFAVKEFGMGSLRENVDKSACPLTPFDMSLAYKVKTHSHFTTVGFHVALPNEM